MSTSYSYHTASRRGYGAFLNTSSLNTEVSEMYLIFCISTSPLRLQASSFATCIDRLAHALVDTRDCLIINAQVSGDAIRRLLLVEAGEYDNLPATQKVGRTVENVLLSSNHKDILGSHLGI